MNLLLAYNGILLRVGLYELIFWPTVGYYVYSDSKQRGLGNPHLRGIVLGVLGIVGLVIHVGVVQRRD